MTDTNYRPPPHAPISEQTVLGQCMVFDYCAREAMQLLSVGDFYLDANKALFKIISELQSEKVYPDVQVVGQRILSKGAADKIGGIVGLGAYIDAACTGQNLDYHARIIKEKSALRDLVYLSTDIQTQAFRDPDPQQFLSESKASIIKLANIHADRRVVESVNDALGEVVKEVLTGRPPAGMVRTGIRAIDDEYGGLTGNLLTVVAGRPSMGKSALLINIAINAGLSDKKVLYITLEDAAEYQRRRVLARMANVNLTTVMLNRCDHTESRRIIDTQLALEKLGRPLFWLKDKGNTPESILHAAVTQKATAGLDALMVDHLGYVRAKGRDEYERTSNAIREFAEMAKELEIPVVVAVQFNRSIEKTGTQKKRKVPLLSDLRGSGHIEEDARVIWMVHRPHKDDQSEDPNEFNVYVTKATHGKTGKLTLWCDMSRVWIRDNKDQDLDHTSNPIQQEIGYEY